MNGEREVGTGSARPKYVMTFDSLEQHAQLKARAALNRRSLNAELLHLIDQGLSAVDAKRCAD